ncbi:unnamed protein product, partial [Scytosiphon promiscuus]
MGEVLYGDYNGHLRPLSSMYFSLDSRCLVADHPESVQEEVESHYCPHCNSLFTTPDAISTENRCPQCFECPCCRCVLVPSAWSSEDSGLVAPDPVVLAEVASTTAREERETSSSRSSGSRRSLLVSYLDWQEARRSKRRLNTRWHGTSAVSHEEIQPRTDRNIQPCRHAGSLGGPRSGNLNISIPLSTPTARCWLRPRASPLRISNRSTFSTLGRLLSPIVHADTDGPDPALWTLANRHEAPGLSERLDLSSPPPLTTGRVTGISGSACRSPPRVRLRTRIGKRCRKDLAAGRTGILIKATFNPLEGDSSTANKGVKKKWFKKDCSAALLVPRITVATLPSCLALLGPTATAELEGPNKTGREQGSVAASLAPASPGGGDGAGAVGAQRRRQPPPSLVLRVVNPQQDTVVRVRMVTAMPSSRVEGAGEPEGGQAAPQKEGSSGGGSVSLAGERAEAGTIPATPTVVRVRAAGWDEGDWVRLEGKEDEVLRQPGDRHRLPDGALLSRLGEGGDGGLLPRDEEGRSTGAAGKEAFLLHQQGDVAWVRVPIGRASAERVAAVASASAGGSVVVVDVRFSFV